MFRLYIGYCYKILRAMRPFLFKSTEEISSGKLNELTILPPSIILHHLFSRAPSSFPSPYTLKNWTVIQYSIWLDKHNNEEEIWEFIKSSLEIYAQQINAKGEKEFSTIYPIILNLGSNLMKNWKKQNLKIF